MEKKAILAITLIENRQKSGAVKYKLHGQLLFTLGSASNSD